MVRSLERGRGTRPRGRACTQRSRAARDRRRSERVSSASVSDRYASPHMAPSLLARGAVSAYPRSARRRRAVRRRAGRVAADADRAQERLARAAGGAAPRAPAGRGTRAARRRRSAGARSRRRSPARRRSGASTFEPWSVPAASSVRTRPGITTERSTPRPAQLGAERLGQAEHGVLGRRVDGLARDADLRGGRRHVDDVPGAAGEHRGEGELAAEDHAVHVHVELAAASSASSSSRNGPTCMTPALLIRTSIGPSSLVDALAGMRRTSRGW